MSVTNTRSKNSSLHVTLRPSSAIPRLTLPSSVWSQRTTARGFWKIPLRHQKFSSSAISNAGQAPQSPGRSAVAAEKISWRERGKNLALTACSGIQCGRT
eukprot:scaffold3350_cov268-Pinguiococcus_pyrenoidosus.AAC.15